ncbi:protein of unknown function [Candidatus Hydrogenisulfobacillus filiaventi]|uniref:Uncharacterized protein n=1 Tax=Candidatus Hydrogenisulfobacillus filiaventi TaxID=2707344 RepID=A0A6F8ZJ56_9FIRM|nr:protein of unknown function [Candidatus Hydrogenisulfobacillus filiaventi]
MQPRHPDPWQDERRYWSLRVGEAVWVQRDLHFERT